MSFADQIRQRVKEGLEGSHLLGPPFGEILSQLAEGLTTADVCAAITHDGVRGRYYLTLWPRNLPANTHLILTFWVTPKRLKVFSDPPQEFTAAERLQKWLVNFVSAPGFLELLDTITQLNREPVEAYLRVQQAGQLSIDDVVVFVDHKAQKMLAEAPNGSRIEITVKLLNKEGNEYTDKRQYAALESSGVIVDIQQIQLLTDDCLRITGTKRLESDFDAEFETFKAETNQRMAKRRR